MILVKNFPWTTVAVFAILVVAVVVLSVTGATRNELVLTSLLALIPGTLAAGYAERTNRDVRNGVVQEKAKEGAKQALNETGVTDIVNSSQDTNKAYMDALNAHTAALTQLLTSKDKGVNP